MLGAYFICVTHLRKGNNAQHIRSSSSSKLSIPDAMLIEAMYIYTSKEPTFQEADKWFKRWDVWLELADAIYETDFILMAEECYWESFLRHRRIDAPVIQIVDIMAQSNRAEKTFQFILKCLEVNPYSAFCREYLRLIPEEERPSYTVDMLKLFAREDKCAVKIQSVARMRGHFVNFEQRKNQLRAKKRKYAQLVNEAMARGVQALQKDKHRRFYAWRRVARGQIELKIRTIEKLKNYFRMAVTRLKFLRRRARKGSLPFKYLDASRIHFNYTRLHCLHHWQTVVLVTDMRRSVGTMRFALKHSYRAAKLDRRKKTITQIARAKRRYAAMKAMLKWRAKYTFRIQRRSLARIREFIRKTVRRRREKALDALLAGKAAAVKKMIYSNTRQLIKRRWVKWRKVYANRRRIWAASVLTRRLPRLLARERDHERLAVQRREREYALQVSRRRQFNDMKSAFLFWTLCRGLMRVQRGMRQKIARVKLETRRKLIHRVDEFYARTFDNCKERHFLRWQQFAVMWKALKESSASRVTVWWQRIHYSRRAVKARKHMKGSRLFAKSFYHMSCARALSRMRESVKMLKTFQFLNQMYSRLRVYYLAVAWVRLREFKFRHDQLRQLLHVMTHKRLGRVFFPGVQVSAHVAPVSLASGEAQSILESLDRADGGARQDRQQQGKPPFRAVYQYGSFDAARGGAYPHILTSKECLCDCGLHDTYMEWEYYVKPRPIALRSVEAYSMLRAFQIMMASYRIRVRRLRSLSFFLAEATSGFTLKHVAMRWASACAIQRKWRVYAARQVLRQRMAKARAQTEAAERLKSSVPLMRKNFQYLLLKSKLRRTSRLRLQAWFRMKRHRRLLTAMKVTAAELFKRESTLRRRSQLTVLSLILRQMQLGYAVRTSQIELKPQDYATSFAGTLLERPVGAMPIPPALAAQTRQRSVMSVASKSEIFGSTASVDEKERSLVGVTREKGNKKVYRSKTGVVVPEVVHSFASDVFHEHLFNLKRSGALVIDSSRAMITNDEIVYLAGLAEVVFCQVHSAAGNNALRYVIQGFRGSKLVVFGGALEEAASKDLFFFCSNIRNESGTVKLLKLHFNKTVINFELIESFSRVLVLGSTLIEELSIDVESVGILGMYVLIASLRVS